MRPIQRTTQEEVWKIWKRVERFTNDDFRSDIRSELPPDLDWFACVVEPQDVDRLFIISSGDWTDISGGSFRVADVSARLDIPSGNEDTTRLAADIRSKISHLIGGGKLDSNLIAISHDPSFSGPFTFIEGNRRSVAFLRQGVLVGSTILVGLSPLVTRCVWACCAYR